MESTVWDRIYKDYQKGGLAWATLSRGLEPDFKRFVKKNKFSKKAAFDIGYGTGHYLQYLKAKGFSVSGIDSSQTAYEMTSKAIGEGGLILGDVYEYHIPENNFDLILSVSAIHHGTKEQVSKAFDQVYGALVDGGHIYITLPIKDSSDKWRSHRNKNEIAPGTFVLGSGPERGLAHSYYTKEEVQNLFSKYKNLKIKRDKPGRWHITAQK
jgi:SAM-dependent methyltransferase